MGGREIEARIFTWRATSLETDPPVATSYQADLSGLDPETNYYFLLFGYVRGLPYAGATMQFTTPRAAPIISSLSQETICALGRQIVISGRNLEFATVDLDGTKISVVSNTSTNIVINLPAGTQGAKSINVTTDGGNTSISITYRAAGTPGFSKPFVPYLYQGGEFAILYSASEADSYRIVGQLPDGFILNRATGSISGSPTLEGLYSFAIVASNICEETSLAIDWDIDKPRPLGMSHRIYFTSNSATIPQSAINNVQRFLDRVKSVSPRHIYPQIYISYYVNEYGVNDDELELQSERYKFICDLFLQNNFEGQVITDVFSTYERVIEIIVYWPEIS